MTAGVARTVGLWTRRTSDRSGAAQLALGPQPVLVGAAGAGALRDLVGADGDLLVRDVALALGNLRDRRVTDRRRGAARGGRRGGLCGNGGAGRRGGGRRAVGDLLSHVCAPSGPRVRLNNSLRLCSGREQPLVDI